MADRGTHRVHMTFFLRNGWCCQFLESDLKAPLRRKFTFATEGKVRELVERGGGLVDSETKNMLNHAIEVGRGGIYLNLSDEQYAKLR